MKNFIPLLLAILCVEAYGSHLQKKQRYYKFFDTDPDARRNVSQLISSKGYPVENFEVQTDDGYLLSIQHIAHGRSSGPGNKSVVLLQHGVLSSSADWVINFENQSLGFILADAGYDVWLSNTRGNTYSNKHTKLSPSSAEYWDFSFEQMAQYDLPAVIDFVLTKTGQEQLSYVGHSQGTTSAFALLSESPAYNKKIKRMIALGPVAYVGYINTLIKYIAPLTNKLDLLFRLVGYKEFYPQNTLMSYFVELLCESPIKMVCEDVMFLCVGTNVAGLNATRLGVYVAHSPASTSVKSIAHYGQMVNSKKFRKYDYGRKENMRRYGKPTPPEYPLKKITTPVHLIWSRNDLLADPVDVGILINALKSLASEKCVRDPLFNHVDFVWGLGACQYVYPDILAILDGK